MAGGASDILEKLKADPVRGRNQWSLGQQADELSNTYLLQQLAANRAADAVMSEEAPDDQRRITADRCWIVDPLDGSSDYPYPDSMEWAVHVALVQGQQPIAAAVAVPGLGQVFATDTVRSPPATGRDRPFVISSRSNPGVAAAVAKDLDAEIAACGSAGVKAMLVVDGTADLYVHASPLWEWDVCAPAAVAAAAGLVVSDLDGNKLTYNKSAPTVRGFVVSRPEFADQVRRTLDRLF